MNDNTQSLDDFLLENKKEKNNNNENITNKKNIETKKTSNNNFSEEKNNPKKEEIKKNTTDIDDDFDKVENKNNLKKTLLWVWILSLLWIWSFFWYKKYINKNPDTKNKSKIQTNIKTWTIINDDKNKETKIVNTWYYESDWKFFFNKTQMIWVDKKTFTDLWHNYAKDKNKVFYKWFIVSKTQPDLFNVISNNWMYKLSWILVTSNSLLEHLKLKSNREFLMTTIASVSNKNINVKNELVKASAYSMDKFKNEYNELNKLKWKDNMTDLQRAKFGVIFLYIKLIKSLESDKIRMKLAKAELKYFIQHSDEILKKFWPETKRSSKINWDIWYDDYCLYLNWKLYWCFLNKIFVEKK